MKVDIVATDSVLWEGEAASVVVPAVDGDLGILPGRQPLLAVLRPGEVRITSADGSEHSVSVVAGFVSVDQDLIEIVVDNTSSR